MKPVGFGGEAIAWEGIYDANGQPTGSPPDVVKDGVFLLTGSKPAEWTCNTPEDGGAPYTEYGWEVSWYNNYQGPGPVIFSGHHAYVICVGKMIIRPCLIN